MHAVTDAGDMAVEHVLRQAWFDPIEMDVLEDIEAGRPKYMRILQGLDSVPISTTDKRRQRCTRHCDQYAFLVVEQAMHGTMT